MDWQSSVVNAKTMLEEALKDIRVAMRTAPADRSRTTLMHMEANIVCDLKLCDNALRIEAEDVVQDILKHNTMVVGTTEVAKLIIKSLKDAGFKVEKA